MNQEMQLGKLRTVDVRSVWRDEARDFTPWLLKNAESLSAALELDFELRNAEHSVGGFSVDLIGKVAQSDDIIIVENQLEQSDHRHLGQVLTYAGGTNAKYIVWVNTKFREEHLSAIRWLNENTLEDVNFFAVEVSAVQIDESRPAPRFEVVAQPNSWQRETRARVSDVLLGERAQRQREFWTRYLDALRARHPEWTNARRGLAQNWYALSAGISGVSFVSFFNRDGEAVARLEFVSSDAEMNKMRFDVFEQNRDAIEKSMGGNVSWDSSELIKSCRISTARAANFADETQWDLLIDWFIAKQEKFRSIFAEFSSKL